MIGEVVVRDAPVGETVTVSMTIAGGTMALEATKQSVYVYISMFSI